METNQSSIRHVLGISGGKDSAALAIYLHENFHELPIEYYFSDTGKEIESTYQYISKLEAYLGKPVLKLRAAEGAQATQLDSFDYFLAQNGGYLPSSSSRWCTKKLKLEPFEQFIGTNPVISYVGIRNDEDREGYVSKKTNVQTIFPYRKNMWSQDVISKVLDNRNSDLMLQHLRNQTDSFLYDELKQVWLEPVSFRFNQLKKLNRLLEIDIPSFNRVVFSFLKQTDYPLAIADTFPLLEKKEVFGLNDVLDLLRDRIGLPPYYDEVPLVINGKQEGTYYRTRSGCYFCFYQQKIEWVWLFENHLELFILADSYEKDGFTWMEDGSLRELLGIASNELLATIEHNADGKIQVTAIQHDLLHSRDTSRSDEMKWKYLKKRTLKKSNDSLLDSLGDASSGCVHCFL